MCDTRLFPQCGKVHSASADVVPEETDQPDAGQNTVHSFYFTGFFCQVFNCSNNVPICLFRLYQYAEKLNIKNVLCNSRSIIHLLDRRKHQTWHPVPHLTGDPTHPTQNQRLNILLFIMTISHHLDYLNEFRLLQTIMLENVQLLLTATCFCFRFSRALINFRCTCWLMEQAGIVHYILHLQHQ